MFIHPGAKQARPVELGAELYNLIRADHGEAIAADALPACRALHELRAPIHQSPTTEPVLQGLKRYVVALNHALDIAKLPPTTAPPLLWVSAFDGSADTTLADLRLDRQGALYNLAVCHASLAVNVFRMRPPTDDDHAFKRAIQLFKQAAGLFAAVAAQPCAAPDSAVTHDLHPRTLQALEHAMLANAQQVFLERNIVNGTSAAFNARFAFGVRDFYHVAERACADPELADSVVVAALGRPCAALRALFHARALDLVARDAQEKGAVGEEIARIRATKAATRDALAAADALDASVLPYLRGLKQEMREKLLAIERELPQRLESAEDQNRRIYFETVPDRLPDVKGRQSVVAVDYREVLMTEPLDEAIQGFAGLPEPPTPELSAAAARYKDLAAAHVAQRVTQLNHAAAALTHAVSSVEVVLSDAQRALSDAASQSSRTEPRRSSPADDRKALDTVRAAQRRGGLRALTELQAQVSGLAADAKRSIADVERLLADEEAQDRQLRLEVQVRRAPSTQIAQPYHVKMAKLRANLERAANADLIVSRQTDDNRDAMAKLDDVVVPAVLPQAPAPGVAVSSRAGDLDGVAEHARPALDAARALLSRKDALGSEFERRKIGEDHFRATASLAADDGGADVDRLGAVMRQAYRDLDGDADALLRELGAKETELRALRERARAVGSDGDGDAGDEYLRCMNDIYRHQAAAAKLVELVGHLEQGLQFYSKEIDNVKLLVTDTEGFVKARDTEFRDIIARPPGGPPSGGPGGLYPGLAGTQQYGGYQQAPGGNYAPDGDYAPSTWRRN